MSSFSIGGAAGEGHLTGQQEMEGAAEGIQVGADVGLARVEGLLRRDVVEGAHDGAFAGQLAGGAVLILTGDAREAHVEDLDDGPAGDLRRLVGAVLRLAAGGPGDEQIARLDVAVDHALLVGVLQAERRLPDVVAGKRGGQRTGLA